MTDPAHDSIRVAVIGLGPAGMRAVERLTLWGRRTPSVRLDIDCFDPAGPGGTTFAPDAADHLRTDAEGLDAWYREGGAPASGAQPCFERWRPALDAAFDRAPLRRVIGAYYGDAWERLGHLLPPGWRLRHHAGSPTSLTRDGERGWRVEDGSYDEVLITDLGPARASDALLRTWAGVPPLVVPDAVAPGSAVAIHGHGPRFTDAVLGLTQGRGGRFVPGRRGHQMTYRRSGDDVAVIYPFDAMRSFAEVRPSADHLPRIHKTLRRPAPAATESASVVHLLLDAAAEFLVAEEVATPAVAIDLVGEALARLEAAVPQTADPRTLLEESVGIAFGDRPLTAHAALVIAWRWLCPTVHELARRDDLPDAQRARLVQLAGVMDGPASGPAPIDGVKLLALVDAGVVDPRSLQGPSLGSASIEWPPTLTMPRPTIDAVVDASPPPVGFAGVRGGLADSLRALGARVAPGRRGVAIGPDAVCAGLPRLACAGGVTKEFAPCALGQGSDRLLDRWAQALLVRCEWADADSLPLDAGRTQRAG